MMYPMYYFLNNIANDYIYILKIYMMYTLYYF